MTSKNGKSQVMVCAENFGQYVQPNRKHVLRFQSAESMTQPHTKTVSAVAVIELVNALISAEILTEAIIHTDFPRLLQLKYQFAQNQLAGSIEEMRLEEALLLKLWKVAAQRQKEEGAGLKVRSSVNEKAKGFLANWVAQCSDLGEAYEVFLHNIAFLNPSECWQMEENAQTMTIHFSYTEPAYPVMAIECRMAEFTAWCAYLSQRTIPIIRASFCHPEPARLDLYQDVFGHNLQFNSASYALEVDVAVKRYPIPSGSAYLKKIMEQKAEQLRSRFPDRLRHSVYSLIADNLLYFQKIDDACNALNMSRSTLYRQLKDEGTSYRDIVDQVRRDKAREFKAQGMKDSYIAEKIGFHDAAAYYKARKRWDSSQSGAY